MIRNFRLKLVVVVLLLCLTNSIVICQDYAREWQQAKHKYGLSFSSSSQEQHAYNLYASRLQSFKKDKEVNIKTYELGETQFTHMTNEERYKILTKASITQIMALYKAPELQQQTPANQKQVIAIDENDLPQSVDWSDLFGEIGQQGGCNACYAFAVTGTIEAQIALNNNRKVSLSEQEILDCTYPQNRGCEYGDRTYGFEHAKKYGVSTNQFYPYRNKLQKCNDSVIYAKEKEFISSYSRVTDGDEEVLRKYVATYGPVSVTITVPSEFLDYKSGVFYHPSCFTKTSEINQAVILVGYGIENGREYWLIRNSWGKTWGINGYGKIARNKNNHCQIATLPLSVTLDDSERSFSTKTASSSIEYQILLFIIILIQFSLSLFYSI